MCYKLTSWNQKKYVKIIKILNKILSFIIIIIAG